MNRKEQIIGVVLDLVEEAGTEAVSTTTIAQRIGLTQPAVFRHYPSKERLWLAVLDWLDDQLQQICGEAENGDYDNPLEALRRTFVHHLELVTRRPALAKLVLSDSLRNQFPSLNERFLRLHANYRAHVEKILREARARGAISSSVRSRDAIALYFAMIQGLGFQTTIARTTDLTPADVRHMFQLFIRAVG